jgi:hypothetical protein
VLFVEFVESLNEVAKARQQKVDRGCPLLRSVVERAA